jgi:UDPglucose--hexose-1-phosphate uridylyltransferase
MIMFDDEAVLLAPYASRVPFQLMLAPRKAAASFESEDVTVGASLLRAGLIRLREVLGVSPPLNMWVRTAPRGAEHFCWRIDIWPRLTNLAGLELGADLNLCILSPEDAAEQLRRT